MHSRVQGVVGEIRKVGEREALAGREELDRVVAVPSPDPSDPYAAEGALPVVEEDRAR
jgi:hypothetical protein